MNHESELNGIVRLLGETLKNIIKQYLYEYFVRSMTCDKDVSILSTHNECYA